MKAVGRAIGIPLLVAIAYIAAAKLGFTMAFTTKQVTAVWPPTGIALAALLLWGYRVWPGIWLGAFLSNAFSAEPPWTAAAIATGNTLAPIFGTYLLRFGSFNVRLERVRDVIALVVFGAAVPMTVSATNGVVNLALAHIVPWGAFLSVWWVWWAGDATGVILLTPLLLTWIAAGPWPAFREGRALELAVLALTLVLATWVSFASNLPLRLSVYPFIIWSGLRFRQLETTTVIAIVCGFAVWATSHDLGPWTSGSFDSRLIQLDSWISVLAITGLILGSVTAERRNARAELQTSLDETKRWAVTLQSAFVPERLPQRPGLLCDVLYIAAERERLIGGDWYDAFDLPDGRIAFSIGDVTGHGLDAAVSAARLRQSIFAAAFDTEDPAEILAKVDRSLRSRDDAPATALVAVVSKDLSTMSYASAGHPPPVISCPGVPARSLAYGGVPFGIGMPVTSRTHYVALQRDTAILFYTDGLIEFKRDIARAELALLRAMTSLANGSGIERPAAFVQKKVMGAARPTDDTVLLIVQFGNELRKLWTYDSRNSHDAHELRREVTQFLRDRGRTGQDLFRAELIIGEVLANTVEHAPGIVSVEVDWSDRHPLVTVSDSGPGLARTAAVLPDPLSENGRGLFLVASLAVDVKIEHNPPSGTSVRVVLPLIRDAYEPTGSGERSERLGKLRST